MAILQVVTVDHMISYITPISSLLCMACTSVGMCRWFWVELHVVYHSTFLETTLATLFLPQHTCLCKERNYVLCVVLHTGQCKCPGVSLFIGLDRAR